MDFVRKNFVTLLVVGATVVLAGVAMFTAMRLYNLRQNPVTPAEPASTPSASDAPVGIRPASGNWNLPEMFVITNTSDSPVELVWNIDCWDENLCEDSNGTETLEPGQSVEKGLGAICSQWQLELNWSGTASQTGDVWDWAGVAELGSECDVAIPSASSSASPVSEETALETAALNEPVTVNTNIATEKCKPFTFTLADTGIGGGSETVSPSPTVKPSATAAPKVSATASPTVTKTPAPQLPEAGVSIPTVMGVMAGSILLLLAFALAL